MNQFVGDYEPSGEQLACVNAVDGIWNVVAGPGSGKTATLLHRHINMLLNGVVSTDTLNLTFTHEAAAEMVRRVGFVDAGSIFRTFHSYALELVRRERQYLPFEVSEDVLPFAGQDYQLLFDLTKTYYAGIKNFHTLKEHIESWKCSDISPEQALEEAVGAPEQYCAMAYRDYEQKCRQQGWLDFDSLLRETVSLLEKNDGVRQRWQRKYIAVDECQDTNVLQFRLLQLIFKQNIFVVGDENQLIYEWRNAQAGNLSNFQEHFPGAQKLYLGRNYRSTGAIVKFLKRILPVDNGLASRMTTENAYGTDPEITKYGGDLEEAHQVIAKIKDPNSVIIARTNRQLYEFQKIMTMEGKKYRYLGKKDFWEQNEVQSLLRLAKSEISGQPAHQVFQDLIVEHRLMERYSGARTLQNDPLENLNSVIKMAANRGNVQEFLGYLRRLTHARKAHAGEGAITLATVHQAKGHEWNNVYVVGVSQKKMPHESGELSEEARIFFVACSRASKELHLSYHGQRSQFWPDEYPSYIYTPPEDEEKGNAIPVCQH